MLRLGLFVVRPRVEETEPGLLFVFGQVGEISLHRLFDLCRPLLSRLIGRAIPDRFATRLHVSQFDEGKIVFAENEIELLGVHVEQVEQLFVRKQVPVEP